MSQFQPPFDDTVQLEDMPVDFSDTSPIVNRGQRHGGEDEEDKEVVPGVEVQGTVTGDPDISAGRAYGIVAILLFINLLNYMDRFTIAGLIKSFKLFTAFLRAPLKGHRSPKGL